MMKSKVKRKESNFVPAEDKSLQGKKQKKEPLLLL